MSGPGPDWVLAAIKAQAEEVLRAAGGAHPSQQAEVLAMASVGRAGLALAHLVRMWFREQEFEAMTALVRPQVLIRGTMPDWLLERLGATVPPGDVTVEFDTTPILLDDALPDADERARQRGLGPDA